MSAITFDIRYVSKLLKQQNIKKTGKITKPVKNWNKVITG